MKEKKWGRLQRTLLMAFTFAMTVVFAGMIGKVDVNAATMNVTVAVKDKETGNLIDDATVIFYDDYDKNNPVPLDTTKNSDGTYSVEWDDPYDMGFMYYKYRATAKGYKDSTGKEVCFDVGVYNISVADILLDKDDSASNKLETAISSAQNEIEEYLDKDKYDADQIAEIESIISSYLEKIDEEVKVGEETEETLAAKKEILEGIVRDAKAALNKIVTSQDNINEYYKDCISFVPESGENKFLARKEYGKYVITLSRFEKGKFIVDNDADTKANWDAEMEMFSYSAGGMRPFEIIDNTYKKGVFFNKESFPDDVNFNDAIGKEKIIDASVTFTKGGKPITVTFDLKIIPRNIYGITVNAPKEVVLEKNEAGDAYKAVEYTAKVSSDDPNYTQNITIESLRPEVAIVNEDKAIIPLKAGIAEFEAKAEEIESAKFTIIFSSIDEVNALIKEIEGLGEITLDNADAVAAARAAYDALSDVAKDKVTGLKTLENAEKKILELRTAAAEAAKAKAEQEKQEALDQAAAAEAAKAEAEKKKQEALDKAAAAEKAKQEALDKEAAAEAAKAEAERQAAAEKAAAEQSEAEKEAAEKAAAEAQAKAEAAEKAAAEAQAKAEAAEKAAAEEKARAEEAERAAAEKVAAAEKAAEESKTAAQEAQKMAEEAVKSTLPNLTLKVKAGKKKATLSWKKANNVTGYIIYRSTKKNGGYEQVKVIKNAKTTKFTDKNLKSKKTYYYKICAYKGNVNGNLSAAKKVKVK